MRCRWPGGRPCPGQLQRLGHLQSAGVCLVESSGSLMWLQSGVYRTLLLVPAGLPSTQTHRHTGVGIVCTVAFAGQALAGVRAGARLVRQPGGRTPRQHRPGRRPEFAAPTRRLQQQRRPHSFVCRHCTARREWCSGANGWHFSYWPITVSCRCRCRGGSCSSSQSCTMGHRRRPCCRWRWHGSKHARTWGQQYRCGRCAQHGGDIAAATRRCSRRACTGIQHSSRRPAHALRQLQVPCWDKCLPWLLLLPNMA